MGKVLFVVIVFLNSHKKNQTHKKECHTLYQPLNLIWDGHSARYWNYYKRRICKTVHHTLFRTTNPVFRTPPIATS